jgi:hypothetical protein
VQFWNLLSVRQTTRIVLFQKKIKNFSLFSLVPVGCNSIKNLKNPNGVYLKTACQVAAGRTYDQTVAYCIANGMELLSVDSPEVEPAIVAHANSQYSSGWLWIVGKNGTNCSVFKRISSATSFVSTTTACNQGFYSYCSYQGKKK